MRGRGSRMANGTDYATYTAGIVHFGAGHPLAESLASLRAQSLPPSRIIVVDHGGRQGEIEDLRRASADVEWVFPENGGFASGANRVLEWSRVTCPDAEFVLIMNPDVELGRDFSLTVIEAMRARPKVALASGKLLRPGGQLIDSAGIERARTRRFCDRGSEEPNDGRFGQTEPVFAVSGAAMMLRRALVSKLAVDGEVFDEDFFVYHEDTDLAWRARNRGYSSLYVAEGTAVHVRGWRRGHRGQIALNIRRHSFKNRYLEMIKNEVPFEFLRDLPFIVAAEVARLGFLLFADRAALASYGDAIRLAPNAWRKRRLIRRDMGHGEGLVARGAPPTE